MAPSGFQQRWKGKITAAQLWIGGYKLFDAADMVTSAVAANSTMPNSGISVIQSGSAATVYTLEAPIYGVEKSLAITQVSSGVAIKAAAGSAFNIANGGSTSIVMKSTIQMSITLKGLSTALWQIISAWSSSTSAFAQPTLSTTT